MFVTYGVLVAGEVFEIRLPPPPLSFPGMVGGATRSWRW